MLLEQTSSLNGVQVPYTSNDLLRERCTLVNSKMISSC